MSDSKTAKPDAQKPDAAKKKRDFGVNKTGISITSPAQVPEYLAKFNSQVKGKEGKLFNSAGFASPDIYDAPAEALVNMGVVIADALGRHHPEQLILLSNICNATSRRIREQKITENFTQMASNLKISLDKFATTQNNPATNKHFSNWKEMLETMLESNMAGTT